MNAISMVEIKFSFDENPDDSIHVEAKTYVTHGNKIVYDNTATVGDFKNEDAALVHLSGWDEFMKARIEQYRDGIVESLNFELLKVVQNSGLPRGVAACAMKQFAESMHNENPNE